MIIAFSTFATFCGYQYSYSELLQYQPKFQKADLTLQHMFIQQIPLVGKVFGSIFELDNTKIIADAHNNTHEYLVRRVLVSLTACIELSAFSRLYIYNNIPSSARCSSTGPSPTVTRPRPSTNMQQRCSPSRSALLRHPARQLAAAHLSSQSPSSATTCRSAHMSRAASSEYLSAASSRPRRLSSTPSRSSRTPVSLTHTSAGRSSPRRSSTSASAAPAPRRSRSTRQTSSIS